MKFGITEAGDAGIDLSWVEKLKTVDGAILVTKNITPKFMRAVLELFWAGKANFIIHVTCTGWGGTELEPNVPYYKKQLEAANMLVNFFGFPKERVVIRVDPIIPINIGLRRAEEVFVLACKMGFTRFRVSVLDMYPHVRERFIAADYRLPYGENFTASDDQFADVDKMLAEVKLRFPDVMIMSCAEPKLKVPRKVGCVSGYDLDILGIDTDEETKPNYQRPNCLCIGNKTELLDNKKRCPHQCLYCYWKD